MQKAIKKHKCPACNKYFTDYAVMWAIAWCEGYRDHAADNGEQLRDGPVKTCCEYCGEKWEYCYFGDKVVKYKPDTYL